jgi:murein DD-endopeptidase MepM/ murein hydrolase activator NlpD
LAVGTAVSQGQYIGAVGNSGSPLSLEGPDGDAHLHLEIWAGDYFLGQFLRPIEIMEWLEEIFP